MEKCMPLEKIPPPITLESIKLNGPSMHIIFWGLIVLCFIYFGWKLTVSIIVVMYLCSIVVRNVVTSKKFPTTVLENIRAGDVILVCRGGPAGESADWAELFMYHVSGVLYTWSQFGHVGQVFRDYDGVLKVADVRYNKSHRDNSKHYIDTIPDFIKNYQGTHYVVHRQLTEEQTQKLTPVVHLVAENAGHCTDCFNISKILETPSSDARPDDIIHFGMKHGLGCAENISMIQRIAGISNVDERFVLPHHFAKSLPVYKLV